MPESAPTSNAPDTSTAVAAGIPFTIASRPMARQAYVGQVSNLTSGSFPPISIPASGFVRKLALFFTCTATSASAGAVVAGDCPWNLSNSVSRTDAT